MRRIGKIAGIAGIAALAIAASGIAATAVSGQSSSQGSKFGVTIYRDSFYRGPAVFVGEAKSNLGLAWPVNSIRVYSGIWELCERPNFQGTCRSVEKDTTILGTTRRGMTVLSIRPLGGGFIGVEADNKVLRGSYAEFHTQPASRGYRIPACPTGYASSSCTKRTADAYCRSIGWSHAGSAESEKVGLRYFLTDVLCENNRG
ncbi:MAG: beta/gamma crystallin-related protein [Erythrobacter sp.]|jgi:hypothetical protein